MLVLSRRAVTGTLIPLYAGRISRSRCHGMDWARVNPLEEIQAAPSAQLRLKGATREIVEIPWTTIPKPGRSSTM